MVIIDLIRHHLVKRSTIKKYRFTTDVVLVGGLAGIAPDADMLGQLLGIQGVYHGGFTHQLWIPGLFFLAAAILYFRMNSRPVYRRWFLVALVAGFGMLTHSLLDCFVVGGYPLLPPFVGNGFCTRLIGNDIYYSSILTAGLDGMLFIIWLLYEERRHKIRDFL
ncbi:MAG: metal-dependent hydrolase [Candidatus Aenigmarchaeota archaeon]|nr:metal-dependent hydrolase [Candidatus Aenigmarchaeota archaeon]